MLRLLLVRAGLLQPDGRLRPVEGRRGGARGSRSTGRGRNAATAAEGGCSRCCSGYGGAAAAVAARCSWRSRGGGRRRGDGSTTIHRRRLMRVVEGMD